MATDTDSGAPALEQQTLFEIEEAWRKEWQGMPEYVQEDLQPCASIIVHFETLGDMVRFSHLLEQAITPNTRSVWYPEAVQLHRTNKRYFDAT